MPQEIHFDIPVDDAERAQAFYAELFGWTAQKAPVPDMEYWVIRASEGDALGGLIKRTAPGQTPINYYTVPSIDKAMGKLEKLGRKVTAPKAAILHVGHNAQCTDTEGNAFGLWENNRDAR